MPTGEGHPGVDELTARVFRALYPQFDLRTVESTLVVVPKGTPWFAGGSLSSIAQQISEQTFADDSAAQSGHAES